MPEPVLEHWFWRTDLYFPWHSHHIKYGAAGHFVWGLLHYPTHVCLLLATRAIAKSIQSLSLTEAIEIVVTEVVISSTAVNMVADRLGSNLTVAMVASTYNTTQMTNIAGALGLNWPSRLITLQSFAGDSIPLFIEGYSAEILSLVGYVSNSYGFPLTASRSLLMVGREG